MKILSYGAGASYKWKYRILKWLVRKNIDLVTNGLIINIINDSPDFITVSVTIMENEIIVGMIKKV